MQYRDFHKKTVQFVSFFNYYSILMLYSGNAELANKLKLSHQTLQQQTFNNRRQIKLI